MVLYSGQNRGTRYYTSSQIGQDDGQSEVVVRKVKDLEKVVCNVCGATYTDELSVEMAKTWIAAGYAPCPNLSCPGQFEVKEV